MGTRGGAVVVGVVVALAGCLAPAGEVCDDGAQCPDGQVCAPAGGCVDPARLEACVGRADGDACTIPGIGAGVCGAGVCVVAACGNAVVDPGEACDDGNTTGGDGCNGACSSTEACGNGVVELDEACDCGDGGPPAAARCAGLGNGDGLCRGDCTLPSCGDAVLDPLEACDDGNNLSGDGCAGTCASDEACGNGVLDLGELCDDGNLVDADACQATCQPPRCGDGVRDAGEACDDGNVVPGDGCMFDCSSDESCGNDELDFFAGELCDDGNAASYDGCSAACVPDAPTWAEQAEVPVQRAWSAGTYDAARREVVVFGGTVAFVGNGDDTWTWAGAGWQRHEPRHRPPPRNFHSIVFDAARAVVVLFGGEGTTAYTDDTWEWDGAEWRERTFAVAPSARGGTMLAYDAARRRVVLFGGFAPNPDTRYADTWEYDGEAWLLRSPGAAPVARSGHVLVHDPVRGHTVLFGGEAGGSTALDDTWTWDGAAWTARAPSARPSARVLAGAQFETTLGRVVVFGGATDSGAVDDMWSWTGTTWAPRAMGSSRPSPRLGMVMVWDAWRARGTLLSGYVQADGWSRQDQWAWVGGAWTELDTAAPAAPDPRTYAAAGYDPLRGEVVLVGGDAEVYDANAGVLDEVWRWDGATWTEAAWLAVPREGHAVTYDGARRELITFGGWTGSAPLDETRAWDGAAWVLRSAATRPSARRGHGLAYDHAHGEVVLFGGLDALDVPLGDTWTWDGVTWTQRSPATSPPARGRTTMVGDPARGQVLLFGGGILSSQGDNEVFGDTWLWDGTTWTEVATSPAPPRVFGHVLSYDAIRRRVVLFGGDSDGRIDQVWEWDGVAWAYRGAAGAPDPRAGHAAAYDARARRLLVFGGDTEGDVESDTWTYRWQGDPEEACAWGRDLDGDGVTGCEDDDCFGVCAPLCPPGAACDPATPRCGDGACAVLEDCRLCPGDCGACPVRCGDFFCDAGESAASCPGDCTP